jgi:Predicted integral membrane protein
MSKRFLDFQFSQKPILRFLPALLVMLAIFLFSARPSDNQPQNIWILIFYKGGHILGYAVLAWSYWRAFTFSANRRWVVWLLALLYAVTDEYHQSFVPGRHPAASDVLVYDNLGALCSVWLASRFMKQKQPVSRDLVVQADTLPGKR